MWWIAFASAQTLPTSPLLPPEPRSLAWWAMQLSPRVCVHEGLVLAEVQTSVRLFGGWRAMRERLLHEAAGQGVVGMTAAPTALAACALWRVGLAGAGLSPADGSGEGAVEGASPEASHAPPAPTIPWRVCPARALSTCLDAMPLEALGEVARHAPTLLRLGCQTLAQVRALPRGGVSRRFGADMLRALDQAYGLASESFTWLSLPEQFHERLVFLEPVAVAEALMFGAHRLLQQLQLWLALRQRGVTQLALHWEHDTQRRSEHAPGRLDVGTGQPSRDVAHLARLLSEHLARVTLAAPVVAIRLEALVHAPQAHVSASFLPDTRQAAEGWGQLIERLSARLGTHRVLAFQPVADHRPHRAQQAPPAGASGMAAASGLGRSRRSASGSGGPGGPDAAERSAAAWWPVGAARPLAPPWLLRQPLKLALVREQPIYQGPLALLAGPQRLEVGWWPQGDTPADLTLRDYFVARSPCAGLLWIYRERADAQVAWFLHGVYG